MLDFAFIGIGHANTWNSLLAPSIAPTDPVFNRAAQIGVFHVDRTFYAWRNDCPHQGGPVCQGRLMKRVEERLDGVWYGLGRLRCLRDAPPSWRGSERDRA